MRDVRSTTLLVTLYTLTSGEKNLDTDKDTYLQSSSCQYHVNISHAFEIDFSGGEWISNSGLKSAAEIHRAGCARTTLRINRSPANTDAT
jgi:hypothetical protein